MLTRKELSQPQEVNWFTFASRLMLRVSSDYISMRLLHLLEPLTCMPTIAVLMIDVAEKSLKLHLAVHTQTDAALADMGSKYGHNLEALRTDCATYSPVFFDADVRAFTEHLNDRDGKLYQQLRYGAQKTTGGFETNLSTIRPVVDKIFCESVFGLPEGIRNVLVHASPIKNLLVRSALDQSRHPEELIDALRRENAYFDRLSEYFQRIEAEQAAVMAAIASMRKPESNGA